MITKFNIFFGTETGNAQGLAENIAEELTSLGIECELSDLSECPVSTLSSIEITLIIVSTWGDGEPPPLMEEFFYDLERGDAGELPNLKYAMIALGDTDYDEFCGCGKKMEKFLKAAGATSFMDTLELDAFYDDEVTEWKAKFLPKIQSLMAIYNA